MADNTEITVPRSNRAVSDDLRPHRGAGALRAALGRRGLPVVCGAWAFALVWALWGSLNAVAVGNDEMSYLLQAKIFAGGRLAAPARPMPEFFQQFHVFVTPVLASKYPPGHAVLLALGTWLHLPGLVPALLVGISASLLCTLTRRFSNGLTAVLAVFLATTSDIALRFNPSYFSETTTSVLFLIGWWAILRYWERPQLRWLAVCAIAVGWGGITRPVTMLAFAVPAGIAVLIVLYRRRRWADFAPSLLVVLVILAFQMIWNHRVVGGWLRMPYSEYSRLYIPADRLGFHSEPAPAPAAILTPDEQAAERTIRRAYDMYTLADVPSAAAERVANLIRGTWSYGGLPGLAILSAAVFLPLGITRVVLGTVFCVFVAYLAWPMDAAWTLYFLELQAPLAFVTAVGVYSAARWLAMMLSELAPNLALRRGRLHAVVLTTAAVLLALPVGGRIRAYRQAHAEQRRYREQFARVIASLPPAPSIVFVRYAPGHGEERLIDNVPDLASAPVWIVHDRGPDNARLRALAPNRITYSCSEETIGGKIGFRVQRISSFAPASEQARISPSE